MVRDRMGSGQVGELYRRRNTTQKIRLETKYGIAGVRRLAFYRAAIDPRHLDRLAMLPHGRIQVAAGKGPGLGIEFVCNGQV